ncbi:histidinol-phosphate transaminase [Carboxydothermus ferrireducens]|uniref:Histidinol-phosphate aminotransferase n=1 Tax=Carboxydothermus ferrireducens DSM 11255 TaxID=1119529 RepID=A0ABX2RFP3_9THEO|nr:histidinol-phosphate transaminase [Carboxydothermus ferrireducens]NYE58643.1 histidinol-phosphate aminotransferase [Carboxydothermus ferrireducens DSM 11255]
MVRKALENLKPYVPGKPVEEVERELGITNIDKLASNENLWGISPKVAAAIKEAVDKVNYYPDGGAFRLKEKIAAKYGVTPDNIILGNGSDELVMFLAMALIDPGDEAVMPVPSFPRYEPVVTMMNGIAREIPLKEHRLDLKTMAEAVNEKTRLVYLCNPNNPTGTYITKGELEEFLERVPEEVVVVLDEAYFEFARLFNDYPDGLNFFKKRPNTVVLRTFSKAYGLAGLRVGYGFAPENLAKAINSLRPPFNVNFLAQMAAVAALDDEEYVREVVKNTDEGKKFLYQEIIRMGLSYIPSAANFLMIKTGKPSALVFRELLKRGVIVRSGDIFGMDDWIRVTVGTPAQNARFINELKMVLEIL